MALSVLWLAQSLYMQCCSYTQYPHTIPALGIETAGQFCYCNMHVLLATVFIRIAELQHFTTLAKIVTCYCIYKLSKPQSFCILIFIAVYCFMSWNWDLE